MTGPRKVRSEHNAMIFVVTDSGEEMIPNAGTVGQCFLVKIVYQHLARGRMKYFSNLHTKKCCSSSQKELYKLDRNSTILCKGYIGLHHSNMLLLI